MKNWPDLSFELRNERQTKINENEFSKANCQLLIAHPLPCIQ